MCPWVLVLALASSGEPGSEIHVPAVMISDQADRAKSSWIKPLETESDVSMFLLVVSVKCLLHSDEKNDQFKGPGCSYMNIEDTDIHIIDSCSGTSTSNSCLSYTKNTFISF